MANDSKLRVCSHFNGLLYEAATGPFSSDENPGQDEVLAGAGDGFGSIIFRILFGDGGVGGVECAPSSTDKAVVRWLGTDGCRIQNSAVIISDTDDIYVPGIISAGTTPIDLTDAAGNILLAALEGHDTDGDVLTWDDTAGEAVWATPTGGGGGAPDDAQYVTLATDGDLDNERVLTGTSNQVIVTDGGAGAAVTLSLPQDIHTGASPTFVTAKLTGTDAWRSEYTGGATDYGVIGRNDGTNFAILLTNAGGVTGSANALRPFKVTLASGDVQIGDDVLNVTHGSGVDIDGTFEVTGVSTFTGGIAGSLVVAGNTTHAFGSPDTAYGHIVLYGGASAIGAILDMHNAASEDALIESFRIEANGNLQCSVGGTSYFEVGSVGGLVPGIKTINLELTGLILQDSWTAPTLLNSWAIYDAAHAQPGYRKLKDGRVELRGRFKSGSVGSFAIFNLPAGYRPSHWSSFAVPTATGHGWVLINPSDGGVRLQTGGNAWMNLDGITFEAA